MFKGLRSTTDLALNATKVSLVVLELHLWLNLTEIKDADRQSQLLHCFQLL